MLDFMYMVFFFFFFIVFIVYNYKKEVKKRITRYYEISQDITETTHHTADRTYSRCINNVYTNYNLLKT